jgi:type II secretory pathway component PulM
MKMNTPMTTVPDHAVAQWWNQLEPWQQNLLIAGGAACILAGAWTVVRHGAVLRAGGVTMAIGPVAQTLALAG